MTTLLKTSNKKHFNYAKALFILLTIICGVLLSSCNDSSAESNSITQSESIPKNESESDYVRIQIEDYISVVFDENDYSGYASPEIIVNEEALDKVGNTGKLAEFNKENEFTFAWEKYTISDLLDIGFSKIYESVSNGDIVEIVIEPDSMLNMVGITEIKQLENAVGIKLSTDTLQITVENLINVSEIEVKLSDIVAIDYGDYNGFGSPRVSINAKTLYNTINNKKYESYINSLDDEYKDAIKEFNNVAEMFTVKLKEPYNYVSNGDKIYYSIDLDKKLTSIGMSIDEFCEGISLNIDTFESFSVAENLKGTSEIEVIDFFKEIEDHIEIGGPNGYGYMYLSFEDDYSFSSGEYYIKYETYSLFGLDYFFEIVRNSKEVTSFYYIVDEKDKWSDTSDLSKGDIVQIELRIDNSELTANGVDIASMRYNVLIGENNLGEFLSLEQAKKESVINTARDYIYNKNKNSQEFHGLYLGTIAPSEINKYNSPYILSAIIYVDNGWYDDYYYFTLYDVYINADGTIDGDFSQKTCPGTTLEDAQEELESSKSYTYEKIG